MFSNRREAFSLIELSIVILVIGILIAGAIQGSRLIDRSRLYSARALTQSSPVAGIQDLSFWVESTSLKSFTIETIADGDVVDQWNDINPQNPGKNDLTQNTPNNRPIYATNGINNLPVVRFDGASSNGDFLNQNNFQITPNITIFIVSEITLVDDTNDSILSMDASSGDFQIRSNSITTFLATLSNNNLGATTAPESSSDLMNSPSLITYRFSSISSNVILRVNGSQVSIDTYNGGLYPTQNLRLACNRTALKCLGADIGEVIIFNRDLKKSEMSSIEEYLKKKWKIN
jgi:prepilin-type N-terminal cleavage/methylation domain-containing protein